MRRKKKKRNGREKFEFEEEIRMAKYLKADYYKEAIKRLVEIQRTLMQRTRWKMTQITRIAMRITTQRYLINQAQANLTCTTMTHQIGRPKMKMKWYLKNSIEKRRQSQLPGMHLKQATAFF